MNDQEWEASVKESRYFLWILSFFEHDSVIFWSSRMESAFERGIRNQA